MKTRFCPYYQSKIIFSEKSLSVHMSVCPSRPRPSPCPPKKSLKLKTLLSKVVRHTIRVTKIHPVMLPPLLLSPSPPPTLLLPPPKPLHFWARRSRAMYIQHNLEFHHLSRVGPKQLCALAHLGSTREAGTF